MAKRPRPPSRQRRESFPFSSGAFHDPVRELEHIIQPLPLLHNVVRSPLLEVEDNRSWHPDAVPEARSPRRSRSHVHLPPAVKARPPSSRGGRAISFRVPRLGFKHPKYLLVCIRRGIRKEVMHAIGKAGGKGFKKPRRNFNSNIRC